VASRTQNVHLSGNVLNLPLRQPAVLVRSAASLDILNLTGRVADGWLPSLAYLPDGPASLKAMNKHIDEGAASAGREPAAVRRLLNISGQFARNGRSLLNGPPQQWAEDLAGLTLEYGITGFILAADDAPTIELFASEVAPATRELVAAERVQR
jgi:alkanesulfonate monooxygenase SsuD/methylene tetrahydromethanopterin reductase-like flavin-dependent oxidoreductase (luciferase family)